jgi:hypothetical protein
MGRTASVPSRAVHQVTGWRRIAVGVAVALVSMTCLLPLSSQANAQAGRPTPDARGVVAQPAPAVPPDDTAQTGVRFRVVTPGVVTPPPPPAPPRLPPHTIASTGLNVPVAELVGLALVLCALGLLFVGATAGRRRARTRLDS